MKMIQMMYQKWVKTHGGPHLSHPDLPRDDGVFEVGALPSFFAISGHGEERIIKG